MALTFLIQLCGLSAQDVRSVEDAAGLPAGVKAPLFKALSNDSTWYALEDAIKKGPVVLIFYRGHWCPHCSKHLASIQDSLELIYDRGATVVAVSPQKPEYLNLMKEKTGASFTLLYDNDYAISNAYDVAFTPTSKQLYTYNKFLIADLKKSQSDDAQRLPVPATYIIGTDGIISWRQFNPDYKKMSTVKGILEALE